MRYGRMLAGLLVLLGGAAGARGERVILKNGYELSGDVLRSNDESVVVDMGFSVFRLGRDEIEQIIETEPNAVGEATTQEREGAEWQLYRTAELPTVTIEENAERFGEGVVMVTSPGGQGSGFVISEDGHVITNYHVIARETLIKVTVFHRTETGFEQKHFKKVKIVALNPYVDLALLKIEEAEMPFEHVYLGDMDEIEAGRQVFAIGNPLGLTRTVSQGIVSTKNRNYSGRLYIQTTTDINPGNSGGPLFDMKGQVVGVTSMGYIYLGGLNFAIPVDVVKRFIENRDAFAYDEDNPNAGYRYLQPSERRNREQPPASKVPVD